MKTEVKMEVDQMWKIESLRRQNQSLLEKLHLSQQKLAGSLQNSLSTNQSHISGTSAKARNSLLRHDLTSSQVIPRVVQYQSADSKASHFSRDNYKLVCSEDKVSRNKKPVLANGIESSTIYEDTFSRTLDDREVDETSTPAGSPSCSGRDTPKSILKHRKIIDDNVHVESQFDHTPSALPTPGKKSLNFSYSSTGTVGDNTSRDVDNTASYMTESDLDGSYLEEVVHSTSKKENPNKDIKDQKNSVEKQISEQEKARQNEIADLYKERLLLDSGNDKKHLKIINDLSNRTKTVMFDTEDVLMASPDKNTSGNKTSKLFMHSRSEKNNTMKENAMLGYDWIAGMLDNEGHLDNKSEDFYKDIQTFRRHNKHDCVSTGQLSNVLDLDRPISPEVDDPRHTCIHGYTVNDRLFPSAMNQDDNGRSICPICLIPRHDPQLYSPGFVRVSIPRSTLETPYRLKPHRRNSFDATDTYALSKHCLAGWECSQPAKIPTAGSLDLKEAINGIKEKCSMTMPNAIRESMSATRNLQYTVPPSARTRLTEELLDASCAMRFGLQKLERDRGLDASLPANTTAYPML